MAAVRKHFREWSVAAALGALLLTLAIIAPAFFTKQQLLTMLTTAAPVLLAACGMALVIIARQIDISIGSQFALCSVCAGLMAKTGWPMPLVALGTVAAGMMLGAFNGTLVAGLGLPSIVVTLATMVTWREALRWWREGEFVKDLPEQFQWFGLGQSHGQAAILICAALAFALLALATKHFAAGRFIYAVGSDREAAHLAGIHPQGVTFGVFVLMGALTGLAALLNAIRFADVDPKTGTGLELQVIAATVVGGIAISGGRGNLWGVLVGVLLLACIAPALVFLQMPPQWEKAIQGAIILLAVAADGWRTRLKWTRGAIKENERIMAEFWQTICPIWFRAENGYELEGSGVLLQIGNKRFLLTAGHVLDRANEGLAYIGLPRGYLQITGAFKATTPPDGNRNEDRVDLGFIALDEHVANAIAETYAFLFIHNLDVLDDGREGTHYVVNGCPWKKVKKDGKTLRPQMYELRLTGRSHNDYPALGLSPERHIAMEFDRKKMTNGFGRRVESPKLSGVSGGPVWKMVSVAHPSGKPALTKRLVGIVIEHHETQRTLIATRILGVLAGIGHTFPELDGLIPRNPKVEVICRDKPFPPQK
jgi:rhamnose transport system permease protein